MLQTKYITGTYPLIYSDRYECGRYSYYDAAGLTLRNC